MSFESYLTISMICFLGAITPGPSLAIVVRNTITGGRKQGVLTGIGHGIGLTIYAFLAVMGITSIIISYNYVLEIIKFFGILVLLKISFQFLISKELTKDQNSKYRNNQKGFYDGFLISFSNPKILIFFSAVFSQFISSHLQLFDKICMAGVAGLIDVIWYVFVAISLSGRNSFIQSLRRNKIFIDKIIGLFLLFLSSYLFYQNITNL